MVRGRARGGSERCREGLREALDNVARFVVTLPVAYSVTAGDVMEDRMHPPQYDNPVQTGNRG